VYRRANATKPHYFQETLVLFGCINILTFVTRRLKEE
jgi:hypothetical protein